MVLTFRGLFPEQVLVSLSLNSRYSCPVEVWQSFTSPQHISLCFLQPRNPTWIVLLNHTVFKSASAVEFPKRSFSYRTWISSSLKAAEALGLLPLHFHFRSLCFDWSAFRVCLNQTSFTRQSPYFFSFKWRSKLAKNVLKELGSYSLLSSFFANRYKELAEKLVQLLRSQFIHLSRLAFQNKKFVEQSNTVFGLFLGVFTFLSVCEPLYWWIYRLWKRLVWFEAIFLKRNVPSS